MDKELFNKNNVALVVIDLQRGITAMPAEPHSSQAVIANAVRLAQAFRENQLPVFLVHVGPSPDGKDRLHPLADQPQAIRPDMPSDWMDIVPELGPAPSDIIITKRQWGAFYGTELDLQLRRRKVETIVLCGIATNIGVESTARFAYEYGYQQVFVEDACAARSTDEHEHTLSATFPRIGRVRKTEDILAIFR